MYASPVTPHACVLDIDTAYFKEHVGSRRGTSSAKRKCVLFITAFMYSIKSKIYRHQLYNCMHSW